MKIRKIKLTHFKRFSEPLELDFTNHETGTTHEIVALIGNNGCGKTSVLQAVAAVLGTACGRLKSPDNLDWPGFDLDLVDRHHQAPSQIEIVVEFTEEERAETRNCFNLLKGKSEKLNTEPGDFDEVCLVYDTLQKRVYAREGASALFQFRGRSYATQLVKYQGYDAFKKTGSTFWYTEQRTATSLTPNDEDMPNEKKGDLTISLLRERLSAWHSQHMLKGDRRKRLEKLEKTYQKIFPRRSFAGPRDRGIVGEIMGDLYMLSDGKREYEISELSGAEKAIFPMLFDFVSWDINASVVMIDELELHCHPPIQQTLLYALKYLGENNQFIITTHSDHVCQLVPENSVFRMD